MGKFSRIVRFFIGIFLIISIFFYFSLQIGQEYNAMLLKFDESFDNLHNPLIGFAPYASGFSYEDTSTLVYFEITWSEVEETKDVYNFESIEEDFKLSKWRDAGKKAVLRFICDNPSGQSHMDIPNWLYEETGDGTFYANSYGYGYCPDYSNEIFIDRHAKVIQAIGDYFADDNFVKYVELGSLGHWGEWHINSETEGMPSMPSSDIREKYVEAYTDVFSSYAKLLMRRPFEEIPDECGLYNDMIGSSSDSLIWLDWIENGGTYDQTGESLISKNDIWDYAPIGGEFTSSIDMEDILTDSFAENYELILDSHHTFIGPRVPADEDISDEAIENAEDIQKIIGYRYYISCVEILEKKSFSLINITIENVGVCPIYFDYKFCVYIEDADGNFYRYEAEYDLTNLKANESDTISVYADMTYEELMDGTIYIGIEDDCEYKPCIYFANDFEYEDMMAIIYSNQ